LEGRGTMGFMIQTHKGGGEKGRGKKGRDEKTIFHPGKKRGENPPQRRKKSVPGSI